MESKLYIIVPCLNEAEVLRITAEKLKCKAEDLINAKIISEDSRILFVNDGSTDNTLDIIKDLHNRDKTFIGLSLSKNFGQQNALLAGIMYAKDKADAVITIDADLQDDINAIDKMIEKFISGCEIVYGIRKNRKTDTYFKRISAKLFYKFMKFLGADIYLNHADFRLMSKKAVYALEKFKEVNLFLRGIIPLLGFKSDFVYYERKRRVKGKSKYSFKKMLSFALDGITSLSIKPIRLIILSGLIITVISFIVAIILLIKSLSGNSASPYCNLATLITFLSGINLFAIGIVGEYMGKVLIEAKARPPYIIETVIDDD